ncbi:MAG: glycosyltransferase family 2 protein [Limisphaerales bacterium]
MKPVSASSPASPEPVPPALPTHPKVSVLIITFNHAATLRQALDSALAQQTSFPVEILVGDDCSTDGSREIVAEYARQYPGRLRAFLHPKNLGFFGKFNFLSVYTVARAPYAILLEGDDYWTSPLKLQKQADFLDARPDCSACFHDCYVQDGPELDRKRLYLSETVKRDLGLREVIADMFPHTTSILFRRDVLGTLPPWFNDLELTDLSMVSILASRGTFGYLPDSPMSVYRIAGGSWTSTSLVARTHRELKAFRTLGAQLGPVALEASKVQEHRRTFYLALGHDALNEPAAARSAFRSFLAGYPKFRTIPPVPVIRLGLKLYAPWLFRLIRRLRGRSP